MEPAQAASVDAAVHAERPHRRMGTVVFDCDSTLSAIEGIEYLSTQHRAEVEALTRAAMDGQLSLEAVYGRRLDLVRPDRAALSRLGRAYVEALVPDARDVVAALRSEALRVRVISGGLLPAVVELARELGLEPEDVAAVDITLGSDGTYSGFDTTSPLARSGGKCEVLRAWRDRLPGPIMMVGDGATDAETVGVIDAFVAFTGVVERPDVVAVADYIVRRPTLAPVLALALAGEPPREPAYTALYEKGLALLDPEGSRSTQPEPRSHRV